MDEYFGIRVAGWHSAFEVEDGVPKFYCPSEQCVPDQSECENPVFPVFADDIEWQWQPRCDTCGKPVAVKLSADRVHLPVGV